MSVYSSLSAVTLPESSSSLVTLSGDQISIGDLGFSEIKQSIISSLKRTAEDSDYDNPLKDFDFASSAINVLVDALAYNTLYYAFYSNMIANELYLDTAQRLESIKSIVKPLGFVVPGGSSARAAVSMSGVSGTIPKYAKFVGTNDSGQSFNFYTMNSYDPDVANNISEVVLFEAKDFVVYRDVTEQINLKRQTLDLNDERIDINSLIVEVSEDNGQNWREYTLSTNVNYDVNQDSKIYFVERKDNGFKLTFAVRGEGQFIATDIDNTDSQNPNLETDNVGRKILKTDIVRVSYMIPTGKSANGIKTFTYSDGTGTPALRVSAFGGSDGPDINLVKFFAPKWFAAQGRAVTKNDYRAALKDLFSAGDDPENSLIVFGGDELDPPYYGRVFVSSVLGTDGSTQIEQQNQRVTQILRDKAPVGIVPEYIAPESFNLNLSYRVNYNGSETTRTNDQVRRAITDKIEELYGTTKFNNTFDADVFRQELRKAEPAIINPIEVDFNLSIDVPIKANENTEFSFSNPLLLNGIGLSSSTFTSPKFGFSNVYITDTTVDPDTAGFSTLRLVERAANGLIVVRAAAGVGEINPSRGFVRIFPGVATGTLRFTATLNTTVAKASRNMLLNVLQSDPRIVEV